MENLVFMTINGSTQGLITEGAFTPDSVGNIYQNGHEDEVAIKSFDYGTSTPLNQAGQISGQRSHQPLSIIKLLDKSSPLLFEASNKGETLTTVELKVYRTSYMGKQEHFYTITLEDAVISSLTASSNGSEPLEYLNFSYRKITLRHETSSTSSSDDIRTGIAS
ncbi:MAG: type VI secretion system tube protein Hcp [Arcobacter sp.]|nr:MAG: type VI secretion system tube protein Hcp [Arcobacter sp.]